MYHFNNFSSLFVIVETNLNLILPKVGLLSFHLVHHPLSQSIVLFCPSLSSKIVLLLNLSSFVLNFGWTRRLCYAADAFYVLQVEVLL